MIVPRMDQRRRHVAEEAADWLITLQSGELSAKRRSEYLEWLRESPVHVAEMLRVSHIDQSLADCARWSGAADVHPDGADNLITPGAFERSPLRRRPGRAAPFAWLAAAGLAGLAILGFWFTQDRAWTVIRTAEGERREVTLADGSTVDVAPASELRVKLQSDRRLVELTRGQAFFLVTRNVEQPFIVDAGRARVRAVGTAFDVSRNAAEVTVTVVEGRVAVADSKAPSREDVFLNANEQISVVPSSGPAAVRKVDGATEVAWIRGNFIFDDQLLADVVRRFNSYNAAQIRILDPALASRRVSGVFRASDPESLIEFVRSMAGDATQQDALMRLEPPAR